MVFRGTIGFTTILSHNEFSLSGEQPERRLLLRLYNNMSWILMLHNTRVYRNTLKYIIFKNV